MSILGSIIAAIVLATVFGFLAVLAIEMVKMAFS